MDERSVDARHILEDDIFTYRTSKDGKVFISWHGKQIMIVKGERAQKFLRQLEGSGDLEAQLVMAKITGNFKHGNERTTGDRD